MSIFGGPGYRSGGGGRRLGCGTLIGVAIILFGVIRYYSGSSVNPITGEKQRVGNITPEQEIALGLRAAPEIAAQMGGAVPENHPDSQTVKRIGQHLLRNSVARESKYQYDFHLLADERTVNAFALPGGPIFITRGLYEKLTDEAELAGVLGHEIGHVVNRHSAEQIAKSQLGQSIITGVGVAASDQNGNSGYSAAMIAQLATQTLLMKYGREAESESDAFGLRIMTESGFDPRAMIDVMKVLEASSKGGRQPEFMQTHPYPENRIKAIERWLSEHPQEAQQMTRGRKLR